MKNILKSEEYDINAPKFKLAFGWMLEIVELGYFIDADVIAALIDNKGKLISDNHIVYYNSELRLKVKYPGCSNELALPIEIIKENDLSSICREETRPTDPEMSVIGSIEYRCNRAESLDNETWDVDLSKIHPNVKQIIFYTNIYKGEETKQNFKYSALYCSYQNNIETEYLYELNQECLSYPTVEICRIFKDTDYWKIKFTGIGYNDIHEILSKHNWLAMLQP